ncbi:MAG: hypothetical protein GVY19_05990 [Bacteroidetes bacterium]|jgi:sigma-E factor negative regulatory protein RseC|nr:hypothetical protein [Bacteroidota bacterium]
MENCTQQTGLIDKVGKNFVRIRIIQPSACAACHARGGCGAFSSKENYLDIPLANASFQPGETVAIRFNNSQGLKAVWYGYVLPFITIITVLLVLSAFMHEGIAGVMALASVGIYYTLLKLFGKNLTKAFRYEIIRT